MDGAVIEPACERVQQVGAMKGVIGRAVPLRGLEPIVEFEELAGLHVARVDAARQMPDGGDLVADADRLQRLDGLRAELTAAPISPKAGAVSKTSAFIPKVFSAFAAASPASPPPTIVDCRCRLNC
jgi:hypothetical protein